MHAHVRSHARAPMHACMLSCPKHPRVLPWDHASLISAAMQPFIEEGHIALQLFPPTTYAYLPPCVAGISLLSVILGYTGILFIQEASSSSSGSAAPSSPATRQ